MKVCGPKLALFGLIVSAWGIFQLFLMGFFFWINSVSLVEDLGLENDKDDNNKFNSPLEFYSRVDQLYKINAYNCWIAGCLYILTLLISTHQFFANSRSSLSV